MHHSVVPVSGAVPEGFWGKMFGGHHPAGAWAAAVMLEGCVQPAQVPPGCQRGQQCIYGRWKRFKGLVLMPHLVPQSQAAAAAHHKVGKGGLGFLLVHPEVTA